MVQTSVFMTDKTWPDLEIEKGIFASSGLDVDLALSKGGTPEEICREGGNCDILMVLFTPMSRQHLDMFPRCRALIRMGIGTNSVDLEFAGKKGIQVANVPDYCQEEVADHTLALFLELTRKVGMLDRDVRKGRWEMSIADPVPRLRNLTFALWGCGGIGRLVGRRAAAFGMKLIGYDPFLPAEAFETHGITRYTDIDSFLSKADVVSLHAPLTPATENMVNEKTLGRMKPTAYILNSSRGRLIDEDALYAALKSGSIAGAGLDVLCEEPPGGVHRLCEFENCVITPHAAWNSVEAIPELRVKAAEEVVRFLRTGRVRNLVNKDAFTFGLRS
ncbi:MAG: C-terminal binding protein [Desulfovibrio sp.]|jgi:D-3-phosphoglycerate dehydrogenase|nr:C-terminal binding protein [Desulfovibrio sp.]